MFRNFITNFTSNRRDTSQLLLLAKIEYGRDWEWAYNELLNGHAPTKGITQ